MGTRNQVPILQRCRYASCGIPGRVPSSLLTTTMTFFILETAATGARSIASDLVEYLCLLGLLLRQKIHDFGGREPPLNETSQNLQRPVGMIKKRFIASAQVVQTGFSVRCCDKPVLGAFPVAGKSYFAFSADVRQCIALVAPELTLLYGTGQVGHVAIFDVA